ncbi:MAG: MFS transporter, partial [Clostridia bacterium]|nr:MFS transporter [Clostridia bacterium]
FTNLIAAVSSAFLIAFPSNTVLLFVSTYLVFWSVAVQMISQPAMNADALDYQQYKTGDRFEGMSGNLSITGQILALGTGFIIPAVYEMNGLLDDYDILYEPLFRTLAILATVFAVLCALPFFFWDLNEKKHKKIIEELKDRAAKENIMQGYAHESILSSGEKFEGTDSTEIEKFLLEKSEQSGDMLSDGADELNDIKDGDTEL